MKKGQNPEQNQEFSEIGKFGNHDENQNSTKLTTTTKTTTTTMTRQTTRCVFLFCLLIGAIGIPGVVPFLPMQQRMVQSKLLPDHSATVKLFNKADNYDDLLKAASDPEAFERYVLQQSKKAEPKEVSEETKKPVSNYKRIEEWDKEQRAKGKDKTLSWEERVQYDGQRHGNQFHQNEILRKNLNGF